MQELTVNPNNFKTTIPFVDPTTQDPLQEKEGIFYNSRTGKRIAKIIDGIPRFVISKNNTADNFAFQWKHWSDTLSDKRSTGEKKYELIRRRTRFDQYKTEGATLLECGMGGGDDTEVLLNFGFSQLHAFDISTAVERAAEYLNDPRLILSQASIYEIPYPDHSFDFVFCHRVLQHTPDPEESLRSICRKVKPGGILFAHCYKRSWRYMLNYKYKYRWLTKRIPYESVYRYVEKYGKILHQVNAILYRGGFIGKTIAKQFIPFEFIPEFGNFRLKQLLELEKLVTFDALTPLYDRPMTTKRFRRIIEGQGFLIEHMRDPSSSPIYCTAVRVRS
jgi:ubiquinone/menaquinone biosynthesis C-methylase UbiE